MTLALQKLRLKRDDVIIKEYGGGPRRLEAVKSGEIAATAINEPLSSLAREQGVNPMVDLVPDQIPWLFSGIWCGTRRSQPPRSPYAIPQGQHRRQYLALSDEKRAKESWRRSSRTPTGRSSTSPITTSSSSRRRTSSRRVAGAENILEKFPAASQRVDEYVDTGCSTR